MYSRAASAMDLLAVMIVNGYLNYSSFNLIRDKEHRTAFNFK